MDSRKDGTLEDDDRFGEENKDEGGDDRFGDDETNENKNNDNSNPISPQKQKIVQFLDNKKILKKLIQLGIIIKIIRILMNLIKLSQILLITKKSQKIKKIVIQIVIQKLMNKMQIKYQIHILIWMKKIKIKMKNRPKIV